MYEESTSHLVAQIYLDNQTQKDKKWFSFSFQTETTLQKSKRKNGKQTFTYDFTF